MTRVIVFNKPFGVLPQFTDRSTEGSTRPTLSDFIDVPRVYPAGRLDRDSEGLMVLTDNGKLQAQISNPRFKTAKTYLVQVEGVPDEHAIQALRDGVDLKDGRSLPAEVDMTPAPAIWPRTPPIRVRKSVPDSWLRITLREGRNRQVRRMTAHVGYPTLRLIRAQIGRWELGDLAPGAWRDTEIKTVF